MIDGKTKVLGIIGDPIEHTRSPLMHNAAFKELGLNFCYLPFHVKPERLKDAIEGVRALNIRGLNVTVPHKERVIEYLDELSEEAKYIGAVNTILNREGFLTGYNTDSFGFVRSLVEEGLKIEDRIFLILGAGGASRAVVYGVLKNRGKVYIYNRTKERALKIKETFSKIGDITLVESPEKIIRDVDIVVNTTSLGLKPDDPMPIEPSLIGKHQTYCDIVYPETPLMREAEKKGCKVIGGLGMLLWQAARAFTIWTGQEAPLQVMKKALEGSK